MKVTPKSRFVELVFTTPTDSSIVLLTLTNPKLFRTSNLNAILLLIGIIAPSPTEIPKSYLYDWSVASNSV